MSLGTILLAIVLVLAVPAIVGWVVGKIFSTEAGFIASAAVGAAMLAGVTKAALAAQAHS